MKKKKNENCFLAENCIYTPILGTEEKMNQPFSVLKILKIYLRKKFKIVFWLKTFSIR